MNEKIIFTDVTAIGILKYVTLLFVFMAALTSALTAVVLFLTISDK